MGNFGKFWEIFGKFWEILPRPMPWEDEDVCSPWEDEAEDLARSPWNVEARDREGWPWDVAKDEGD